jgi:hypothetical protein
VFVPETTTETNVFTGTELSYFFFCLKLKNSLQMLRPISDKLFEVEARMGIQPSYRGSADSYFNILTRLDTIRFRSDSASSHTHNYEVFVEMVNEKIYGARATHKYSINVSFLSDDFSWVPENFWEEGLSEEVCDELYTNKLFEQGRNRVSFYFRSQKPLIRKRASTNKETFPTCQELNNYIMNSVIPPDYEDTTHMIETRL